MSDEPDTAKYYPDVFAHVDIQTLTQDEFLEVLMIYIVDKIRDGESVDFWTDQGRFSDKSPLDILAYSIKGLDLSNRVDSADQISRRLYEYNRFDLIREYSALWKAHGANLMQDLIPDGVQLMKNILGSDE